MKQQQNIPVRNQIQGYKLRGAGRTPVVDGLESVVLPGSAGDALAEPSSLPAADGREMTELVRCFVL